ncbi:MAG: ABC transporter permease, partial [Ferruginibacter sp.]|nr:ABC transporter permease [Cytophagales bacterium]
MLRNYLKTALRNLWTNKSYGFLNLIGLAVGIACAALILRWVADELAYNHQFEKRNVLYRVMENQTYDGITSTFRATPGPFAGAVKAEIPGVRNTARMGWDERALFARGDQAIYEKGHYVDSAFFSMFTLPFVKGKARGAFDQVHTLVISEKMANRFFGKADPIGKTLKVNNERDYTVTGVVRDLPANTSFEFDWLAPFILFEAKNTWLKEWGNNGIATFVELQPAADPAAVDKQLYGFLKTKAATVETKCFLFSVNEWRLYDKFQDGKQAGGRIKYVKLFTLIAWIILLIACVNFMNLATARSEQRAREVGVRKVLGADQRMLVGQFMGESLVMSSVAVLVAVGLVYAALPGFNALVEKKLTFNVFDPVYAGGLLAIGLVSGLIAGSYPAFYLSSFNPVAVLKGLRIKTNAGAGFVRKGLVVAQFAVSMVLMIGTGIVYQQVQHVKDLPLGYDRQNLIYLDLRGNLADHFSAVKSDLLATGVVSNAATSNSTVLELGSNGSGWAWPGKDPTREVLITQEGVSPEYLTTMGMQLRAGRDFYPNAAADSNHVIINETLAKLIAQDGAAKNV